jgi:putative SOS response-associated peptidase YedK
MCGRYTLLADELHVKETFHIMRPIKNYETSYNIAPGQNVLAVIHDGKEKRAGYLQWGLVPFWAKDKKVGYKMINARSETAHVKPSFRHLMSRKRCLIVADSFYEWEQKNGSKQPKRIHLEDRDLFAFAGLWDKWTDGEEVLFTCAILTRESNPFMANIHHRMPIILPKDKEEEWIQPRQLTPNTAKKLLDSINPEKMTAYNVGTHVNAAKNNDPMCIEPIA